ncbi:MAG: S-methyl-5'-thioadenosine phosphorylase [Polyangiaceae bacterium]|nr:S-methyl-5'-thioadenosine phosphorylase [Polyangiaceae bacterium]
MGLDDEPVPNRGCPGASWHGRRRGVLGSDSMKHVLGVIGGTGFHEIPGMSAIEEIPVTTPYGPPSDVVLRGEVEGTTLLFLPRHGRDHRIPPHCINFRANVCAMKSLGAEQVVSISAVGSMQAEIEPGHLVVVDQFIDLTRRRVSTFFDGELVGHVAFADPVCPALSRAVFAAAVRVGATVHPRGTYVCIDGPQFSTRAESALYRTWGVSVIGMTAMPEAKLAREAQLPYAVLALATDYDCWHETEEAVTVEGVLAVMRKNTALAQRVVGELARTLPDPQASASSQALAGAVMTRPGAVSPEARARLSWLLDDGLRPR